jgi:hypothetical protein
MGLENILLRGRGAHEIFLMMGYAPPEFFLSERVQFS